MLRILPSLASGAAPVSELVLEQAWHVSGPDRFDASGFAMRNGTMFLVSDRHQHTIFRLQFEGDAAEAVPAVTFTGPEPWPQKGYLDLEGLACAADGGFFLAAEWGFAVAHVPAGGGHATWITPDLRPVGQAAGLFATTDAYLEGVTILDADCWLVAIEREPRGLIEVRGTGAAAQVRAQKLDASNHPVPPGRNVDFSDLCTWRGRVFALARNQHLVVELRRTAEGAWTEGAAWSFAEAENAGDRRFVDRRFGMAEGLGIDDERIYVLLDNNAVERESSPGDRRSWLFAFTNPMREYFEPARPTATEDLARAPGDP